MLAAIATTALAAIPTTVLTAIPTTVLAAMLAAMPTTMLAALLTEMCASILTLIFTASCNGPVQHQGSYRENNLSTHRSTAPRDVGPGMRGAETHRCRADVRAAAIVPSCPTVARAVMCCAQARALAHWWAGARAIVLWWAGACALSPEPAL